MIGKHGQIKIHKNKRTLVELCLVSDLTIMNKEFSHKEIYKITGKVKSRVEQSIIGIQL